MKVNLNPMSRAGEIGEAPRAARIALPRAATRHNGPVELPVQFEGLL